MQTLVIIMRVIQTTVYNRYPNNNNNNNNFYYGHKTMTPKIYDFFFIIE